MALEHPTWGQQTLRLLADEIEVHAESETVRAGEDETLEAFLARLLEAHQVTDEDAVDIVYQADRPHYAIIRRAAFGA